MVMKSKEQQRSLGKTDVVEDYAIHPTQLIVRGMKGGKPFKSLLPMERFEEVIEKCNRNFKG